MTPRRSRKRCTYSECSGRAVGTTRSPASGGDVEVRGADVRIARQERLARHLDQLGGDLDTRHAAAHQREREEAAALAQGLGLLGHLEQLHDAGAGVIASAIVLKGRVCCSAPGTRSSS